MNYKVSKTLFKIVVIFLIFQILISINVNASSMNVEVEIYDDESIGKVWLRNIYSNNNGYYSTSILNNRHNKII